MELLNEKQREALKEYPLYSQDGKGGEALAVVRLFITGTAATFYITEANLATGELYGVSNMERGGWRYGYFSLPELSELSAQGGLIHTEADVHFEPTPLKDLPEVADELAALWAQTDADDDEEDEPEQRDISYGELAALQTEFRKQVEAAGVVFEDEEAEAEALFDFTQQYIDGNDAPQLRQY